MYESNHHRMILREAARNMCVPFHLLKTILNIIFQCFCLWTNVAFTGGQVAVVGTREQKKNDFLIALHLDSHTGYS